MKMNNVFLKENFKKLLRKQKIYCKIAYSGKKWLRH